MAIVGIPIDQHDDAQIFMRDATRIALETFW